MKVLVFSERSDYSKVLKVLMDELNVDVEIQEVTACRLANLALSRQHDLILLDDRLSEEITPLLLEAMARSQVDVMVCLKNKDHVKKYMSLNLLGYYVSPIDWKKVLEALKILVRRNTLLEHYSQKKGGRYMVKEHNSIYFLPYEDILFFEKVDKLVKIHTRVQSYEIHDSLKNIVSDLPSSFLRVHSSYIVNFNNVDRIIENQRTYNIEFESYDRVAHMSRKKADDILSDGYQKYRLSHIVHHGKD
ncbi:MAG: LytTR family transcriptional regulator DNA-binding domain-containing protein [Clostridia bacterium]|nr:LytTR family transcriptional regulator DNA-binding domain-containing protein [Clostridia bacterium]